MDQRIIAAIVAGVGFVLMGCACGGVGEGPKQAQERAIAAAKAKAEEEKMRDERLAALRKKAAELEHETDELKKQDKAAQEKREADRITREKNAAEAKEIARLKLIERNSTKVTRENYAKIMQGMTIAEVEAILGLGGKEAASGNGVLVATWQSPPGIGIPTTTVSITFKGGRVDAKAIAD